MKDKYESTFSALKTTLTHLDEDDRYQTVVNRAEKQLEEENQLQDETIGSFLEMLYNLYDHAKAARHGNVKDLRQSTERQKEQIEDRRKQENQYLVKRGEQAKSRQSDKEIELEKKAYEHGLEENEYRHDIDAVLGAMEMLSEVVDDPEVTYERMQKEAEEYRKR